MPAACNEIIDDIEDLISSQDITPKERYSNKKSVTVRARKRHIIINKESDEVNEKVILQSIVPGTQTVWVKTWGCAHNNSDSEYMAGQLATYGYPLTEDKNLADLWLLNSCTVKNPSEDTFRNEIEKGQKAGKHIVLAGCVPQGAPKTSWISGLSVVGVQQLDRVVEVVEETLKGHTVRLFSQKKVNGKKAGGAPLAMPKVRKNPLIEIIPINTGCLNQCTYCKTKHARGDLASYPPEEIVNRARQAFEEGVCEIWLTSEDTGTYGRDIGTSLPELLWALVEVIPEGCRLRLGMTNPPYILEHLEEMSRIMAHPRVYSFLHLPVQSGSDAVLSDMKREYCRADFERVVTFLRERVPGVTIATDIIAGFPTETATDWDETMSLCSRYQFPSLFINQYYARPGTPAALMQRNATTQEVKKRTKQLSQLFNSYELYRHKIGEIQNVLVTEVSHDKKHYVGHNKYYEQVLVPMKEEYMGKIVTVKVVAVSKFSMTGAPIEGEKIKKVGIAKSLSKGQVSGVDQTKLSDTKASVSPYILIALVLAVVYRFIWIMF